MWRSGYTRRLAFMVYECRAKDPKALQVRASVPGFGHDDCRRTWAEDVKGHLFTGEAQQCMQYICLSMQAAGAVSRQKRAVVM